MMANLRTIFRSAGALLIIVRNPCASDQSTNAGDRSRTCTP